MSGPLPDQGIRIEVVYAEAQGVLAKVYRLKPGSTVADALRLAAADPEFASMDVSTRPVGVFGRLASSLLPLADGDRVELYRALPNDPKLARRARVRQARLKN